MVQMALPFRGRALLAHWFLCINHTESKLSGLTDHLHKLGALDVRGRHDDVAITHRLDRRLAHSERVHSLPDDETGLLETRR